jgi:hypothetical protein
MSTTFNIYDTSMPNNWSEMMMYEYEWDLRPEFAPKVLECIFIATAEILASAKMREQPVTLVYRKINKEVVAAATVQFFANEEDPTKPGNWSLVWTFNAADIPANAQIIEGDDPNVFVYYRAVGGSKFNFEYDGNDVINTLNVMTLASVKKWLDENAKENDEVVLSLDNVFQARVAVENGVKEFALEPIGEIKMIIKDDASIEK